ncbi:MAG: Glutaminyl-tRNA synthetase [Geoglossum simile]|nr:MAG: Glutaminyl-tRNA synthetase [Geoglossum simile]
MEGKTVLPIREKAKKEKKDNKPKSREPKANATPKKEKAANVPAPPTDPNSMFKEGFLAAVHQERAELPVFTRFPPEPNGYLHIGHSKAIAINFGFARFHGGQCYLRYDDTNPEAEEKKYFVAIQEMIQWLGFEPFDITYSSDHFDELYELAEKLIQADKAYVCHCTDSEVKLQRGGENHGPRFACPHRNRPVEESLSEFRAMRDGKYKPKEAFLRMKQNLEDGNPQMWDLTAYRILDAAHHRTGDKWRVYPTYDFTHCLCDSFEKISHSLCTTEFILSRTSYEWLCDALEIFKPMQREYGRLKMTGTVLSKRKIIKLISEKVVRDWDDPRLYTLVALRRRGVPPGAILSFVNEVGVTTAVTNIQIVRFETSIRRYLEQTVPRLMLILDPIPIIIEDLPDDYLEEIEVPFGPKNQDMGSHVVPFTKTVYIDRSDFREVDSKDYFRLAPGKSVGLLKVPFPIRATTFTKDPETGLVTEIRATYERPEEGVSFKKPKTYIQWIALSASHNSPIQAEVRVFNPLFKSENPDAVEGGFMNDVNPSSQEIYPNAIIETGLEEIRKRAPWPEEAGEKDAGKGPGWQTVRFQGMRIAYFAMDKDSEGGKVVLNRIVSLKEDASKGG